MVSLIDLLALARGLFDNCTDESGLRDALQLPIRYIVGSIRLPIFLHLVLDVIVMVVSVPVFQLVTFGGKT